MFYSIITLIPTKPIWHTYPRPFEALQSFWNNVVKNPKVTQGSIKADSVVVLPQNYGWGARWETDHIWGIFAADNKTSQYWNLMQATLQNHGLNTDIVYADPQFPLPRFIKTLPAALRP